MTVQCYLGSYSFFVFILFLTLIIFRTRPPPPAFSSTAQQVLTLVSPKMFVSVFSPSLKNYPKRKLHFPTALPVILLFLFISIQFDLIRNRITYTRGMCVSTLFVSVLWHQEREFANLSWVEAVEVSDEYLLNQFGILHHHNWKGTMEVPATVRIVG